MRMRIAWTLVLLLAGCGGDEKKPTAAVPTAGTVPTITLSRREVPEFVEAVGTLRAARESQIASQLMADIVRVHVREGDRVRRGEQLVSLDARQADAGAARAEAAVRGAENQLAAALADLRVAQATYERYRALIERKSVTRQEMDEVEARFRGAEAQRERSEAGVAEARAALTQARTMRGYAEIRAPFDGVVTARLADEGTLAVPGSPLLTLEDLSAFTLDVVLDERDVAWLQPGKSVPVSIDALKDSPLEAKVARIIPAADPQSRTFTAKLELPRDARLRSGMFGRAHIPAGSRQALLVPRAAVQERGQIQSVYVVNAENVVRMRYVTLGPAFGDEVEVLSGLSAGERVVREAGIAELAGKRIEDTP